MKQSKLIFISFFLTIAGVFTSCNLDEELNDTVVGEANVAAGAADLRSVFGSIGSAMQGQESVFALQMHSSDELMGPTRGTDWSDFGVWRALHLHTWDAGHPQVLFAWNDLHIGVTRANDAISGFRDSGNNLGVAQARFLRAYILWQLTDLFGNIPYRDETDTDFLSAPPVLSRSQAAQLVVDELEDIVDDLPLRTDPSISYGDVSKEAAWALLAKVYLNKFVYDGLDTAPTADLDKVIEYSNDVINAGYTLADGDEYFSTNFGINNENSPESIFVLVNDVGDNPGGRAGFGSRTHMTLHYNQNPSSWNGFTTIADFYNTFDQNDKRFRAEATDQMKDNSGVQFGLLEGQQFDKDGNQITERGGAPLSFTVDIPLSGAAERRGVRVIKYEIDYNQTDAPGVDYPLIRFADIWLCRAEAEWRKGNDGTAISQINTLRANRGVPDITSIAANGQEILDERGFELYWEGHRRTDLIRFDQFNRAWEQKAETPEYTKLFPIPQAAVDVNPNQEQNPGY